MVEFEWVEDKQLSNLEKHKRDFFGARDMFDGRSLFTTISLDHDEVLMVSTGVPSHRRLTVIWSVREARIRIISFRRPRNAEERNHRQLYS
ncbi:MAG: BrnT family toxin [Chloroflexota bacterium]|nr:BrnT family toxin [Chloroflexota bacterium]